MKYVRDFESPVLGQSFIKNNTIMFFWFLLQQTANLWDKKNGDELSKQNGHMTLRGRVWVAWGVDYLGSGGAGLLIATQKLMSEEKSEETEQQTGSLTLMTANTSRKKRLKGRKKIHT